MPRNYVRSTLRASWSETDLDEAMKKVRQKEMGVNEAARTYNIPSRTLRRHILAGTLKVGLGRRPVFNQAEEKKLVAHIKQLEKVGFAPDRKDVKEMAYQLAHKLNIKNIFSNTSKKAGDVWFNGFLKRNPELSQRKSEGLSLARAYGVNRADVQDFFTLLAQIYTENDLSTHPEKIFNMDETGIQVNNKPSKVIATKGSKDVYTLTSSEKGENVTVIACCNAQGNFLPPVLIYKGTYSKPQFSEGLPPGSQVFMNKKSSYINTDLFMKWFEEIFLPAKGSGKALLIMDGHSSHSNNIRLLEVAKDNDVTLLCFPSHTTHAMQPLDRAFFRPFKVYFAQEAKSWMIMNKNKKLTRYDVSKLIGKAWCKAASVSNGVSALKSCGIYPYDPNAIPDHFFALSDALREQDLIANEQHAGIPSDTLENSSEQQNDALREQDLIANEQHAGIPSDTLENSSEQQNVDAVEVSLIDDTFDEDAIDFINQLTSDANKGESLEQLLTLPIQATPQKRPCLPSTSKTPDQTPTKVLAEIFPVPKLPAMILNKKQTAVILTSPENIQKRKLIEEKKKPAKICKLSKKNDKKNVVKKDIKGKRPAKKKAKKNKPVFQSSDSDNEDENKKESSDEELSEEDNENRCVECTEDYYKTTSTEDWIKCSSCSFWLHEFCTMYKPLCNICGKKAKREKLSRRKK